MATKIGAPAPQFTARAYIRATDDFKPITSDDYRDQWLCLYFFRAAFSSLCPTEVAGFNAALTDLDKRGCRLLGCSTDSHHVHRAWCKADEHLNNLKHPLLSDITKQVAMDFGVLLADQGVAQRGTFLIDPRGTLRWIGVYDPSVGRSIPEVLRVLDALQTGELCPCDWQTGNPTLKHEP